MEFKSIDEIVAYIESVIPSVLNECSYDMQEIMIDEIMKQIYKHHVPKEYDRTGQLLDTPQLVDISNNSVTMEFLDNGGWKSVYEPYEHINAFEAWEEGKVWGEGTSSNKRIFKYRPATNIHEASLNKCENEIPNKFKSYLQNMGIPIE